MSDAATFAAASLGWLVTGGAIFSNGEAVRRFVLVKLGD
jgi:hypothetical protein